MAQTNPQSGPLTQTQFSPTEIVVKLLEKTLQCLEESIVAIDENDIETRCNVINLASEIVTTLHLGLDFERGGETADRLGQVYRFVLAQLIRINIGNDADLARRIIEVMRPLRDAWLDVHLQSENGEKPADLEALIANSLENSGAEIARLSAG